MNAVDRLRLGRHLAWATIPGAIVGFVIVSALGSRSAPAFRERSSTASEEQNTSLDDPSANAADDQLKGKEDHIIGATARIVVFPGNLVMRGRVDSGATTCSIHAEDVTIENEAPDMKENVGKTVHFRLRNERGETQEVSSEIEDYARIATTRGVEMRYKTLLTFRWRDVEKTVAVTLNDRSGMEYPLLLGRNFLREDFLIDVDLNEP